MREIVNFLCMQDQYQHTVYDINILLMHWTVQTMCFRVTHVVMVVDINNYLQASLSISDKSLTSLEKFQTSLSAPMCFQAVYTIP